MLETPSVDLRGVFRFCFYRQAAQDKSLPHFLRIDCFLDRIGGFLESFDVELEHISWQLGHTPSCMLQ